MSLALIAFIALLFAAGLAAALLMGEARRFLVVVAVVGVLIFFVANEVLTVRAQAERLKPRPAPTFADILPDLIAPFPTNQVYVKPGATNKEKDHGLALIYLDRQAIEQRLDDLVGSENWDIDLLPWGDNGIICTLTIMGVIRRSSGESEIGDPNCKTSAEAQAFKRTFCKFGCRYTYTHFPKSAWFAYDSERKTFVNPYAVIIDLYQAAGLEDYIAEETVLLARETARKRTRHGEHDDRPPSYRRVLGWTKPHYTPTESARPSTPRVLALAACAAHASRLAAQFGPSAQSSSKCCATATSWPPHANSSRSNAWRI